MIILVDLLGGLSGARFSNYNDDLVLTELQFWHVRYNFTPAVDLGKAYNLVEFSHQWKYGQLFARF